jgi:hypothetical protein
MLKVGISRNQCRGCSLYFNSNSAFEDHRTGTFGVDRRCRTSEEMQARGYRLNKDGYWAGEPREDKNLTGELHE